MQSNMTVKSIWSQRLPVMLTTSVLGIAFLLSGCSNNDESVIDAVDMPVVVDNADDAEVKMNSDTSETSMPSPSAIPAPPMVDQPSLVTNSTEPNTPEDAVKQALNTLYYGDVEDAVGYYQVDIANFEQELANTQSAFQQTVTGVTMTGTSYNDDKTLATIEGELMLKGQDEPAPLTYQLQKINGQWKILG